MQTMARFRFVSALAGSLLAAAAVAAETDWKNWRGPAQNGVAPAGVYPTHWSVSEGVAWRQPLPGRGGSTPIVVGSKIFLTAGHDGKNHLLCLEASSGQLRWRTPLGEDTGGKHRKGSGSNPSPVSDGERIFAYFRSGDLACVDSAGQALWEVNLQDEYGEDTLWWDLGTSPVLTDRAVVVAVMQSGPSYLVAFEKSTGNRLWKVDRMLRAPEESAQSYTTPLRTLVDDREVIAVFGADHLTLHDAGRGEELARLGGFNPDGERFFRSIASPVIDGDVIICPYSRGSTLTGVSLSKLLEGAGDEAILWQRGDLGADVPTPASLEGKTYVCTDRGRVECIDSETGQTRWGIDLARSRHAFSSSPLLAGEHLYLTREDGVTFVVDLDADEPDVVATNELGPLEPLTVASPVPVDEGLLLRTSADLVRVAK